MYYIQYAFYIERKTSIGSNRNWHKLEIDIRNTLYFLWNKNSYYESILADCVREIDESCDLCYDI